MSISIVIPLYNKESHVARAMESVLAQTYTDYELIVVDDGSTDNSYEVARSLEDDRIKIVRQSNQGECAARNRGVSEASYELVAFLDADDRWTSDFLMQINFLINKYPECGVYSTFYEIYDELGFRKRSKKNYFESGWHGIIENYFQLICEYFPFNSSSVVVRKDILRKIDGFPNGVRLGGDKVTWFKLYLVTKFAYLNLPLSIYHFDVENRASVVYKNSLDSFYDYYPIETLSGFVRDGRLSLQDRQYVIDFLGKNLIPAARYYLEQGDNLNARKVLDLCKGTRRYARIWKKYHIYACLPPLIGKFAIQNRPE